MKPKIIFIASYAESLLTFRLQLMQEFVKSGAEVLALAPAETEIELALAQHGIRFQSIALARNGTNPLTDLKLLLELHHIFKTERPERIFSYTLKPMIYASLAARWAGVSSIYALVTGAGYIFTAPTGLKNRIISAVARRLLRHALGYTTKIFFQNPDNRALFIQHNIIASTHATAIVNGSGVDCQVFAPAPYPDDISFLMVARLLRDKGVAEYATAARKLRQHFPHIQCKLVGWIDSNPNAITEAELTQWINAGDIVYLGKLDLTNVKAELAQASVYVLPSYHEGIPRTVLEAMAMARPVITTNAPGCRETVQSGLNGYLIPVQDAEALYQAMRIFVTQPENIPQMGTNSRLIAAQKYDVHKVNSNLIAEMAV